MLYLHFSCINSLLLAGTVHAVAFSSGPGHEFIWLHAQGRGGDELGAEFAKGLERSMYAGITGTGSLGWS